MVKFLARGAEAELFADRFAGRELVVKRRVRKRYRIRELDEELRRTRTKNEASLLHAAKKAGVLCPVVYEVGEFDLVMSFIKGTLLRGLLRSGRSGRVTRILGERLADMHGINVVHGDFTTANVIVSGGKPHIIDFGLGCFSRDVEDKAIDVLLMKKSLGNDRLFRLFLAGYSKSPEYGAVIRRVSEIEKRGRYAIRSWARA